MATLLGRYCTNTDNKFERDANEAFFMASKYLPDSDFVLTCTYCLCSAEDVVFCDGGIDGACVPGSSVRLYSYKVPCSGRELFIYVSNHQYYYVTKKCVDVETGSECYVEFTFKRELYHEQFNRNAITSISNL